MVKLGPEPFPQAPTPVPDTSATAYTVRAAPLALWSLLQLWVQADQVVRPRASVTQNDLPTLLAHFTVVLVVCLIAVTIVNWKGGRGNDGGLPHTRLAPDRCLNDFKWMVDRPRK